MLQYASINSRCLARWALVGIFGVQDLGSWVTCSMLRWELMPKKFRWPTAFQSSSENKKTETAVAHLPSSVSWLECWKLQILGRSKILAKSQATYTKLQGENIKSQDVVKIHQDCARFFGMIMIRKEECVARSAQQCTACLCSRRCQVAP